MTCSVCSHENSDQINHLIVHGGSERGIALRFGMSAMAVHRHRRCVKDLIARASRKSAGRVMGHVEKLVGQLQRMADDAHSTKQAAAFLMVARELRPTLELFGKLTGEVQAASIAAFLAALGVRDESEVRSALELVRSSGNPSLDQCEEEAVALLLMVLRERPERRGPVLARLGSHATMLDEDHNGEAESDARTNGTIA